MTLRRRLACIHQRGRCWEFYNLLVLELDARLADTLVELCIRRWLQICNASCVAQVMDERLSGYIFEMHCAKWGQNLAAVGPQEDPYKPVKSFKFTMEVSKDMWKPNQRLETN